MSDQWEEQPMSVLSGVQYSIQPGIFSAIHRTDPWASLLIQTHHFDAVNTIVTK